MDEIEGTLHRSREAPISAKTNLAREDGGGNVEGRWVAIDGNGDDQSLQVHGVSAVSAKSG